MNVLSIISFTNFILFVICALYSLEHIKGSRLGISVALVFLSLALWCFGGAFFYTAKTAARALFWYRVGSVGWITLPVFALRFMLGLTRYSLGKWVRYGIYAGYVFPLVLLLMFVILGKNIIVREPILSGSGLGWTVVNDMSDPWLWFYLVYLIGFLTLGIHLLRKWKYTTRYYSEKRQSGILITMITALLILALSLDIFGHLLHYYLPPLSNVFMICIVFSSTFSISRYHLFDDPEKIAFRTILANLTEPVMVFNEDMKFTKINPAVTALLGYQIEALRNKELKDLIPGGAYNETNIQDLARDGAVTDRFLTLRKSDGNLIHAMYSATMTRNRDNEFAGYIISIKDITRRKQLEQKLIASNEEYRKLISELFIAANFDSLTGLPNRRSFFTKMEELSRDLKDQHKDMELFYMDLNGFKAVNDSLGHEMGDKLLVEVAQRLKHTAGEDAFLARMGGDEFVLVLSDCNEAVCESLIQEIHKALESDFDINGHDIRIGVAIGRSSYSVCNYQIDEMIHQADTMMYREKIAMKAKEVTR